MKKLISLSLTFSLVSSLFIPIQPTLARNMNERKTIIDSDSTSETLISQRNRAGGNRSGGARRSSGSGNRGKNFNRSKMSSNGSGRVNRNNSNRSNGNISRGNNSFHKDRNNSNRIDKDKARNRLNNVDRDQARNRLNNIDRDEARNRLNNVDRDKVRNQLNNVDRDKINNRINNRRNIDFNTDRRYSNRINRNIINTGDRNIIVNPRGGWGGWGWNGGNRWYPNYGYWGGGFWGSFAAGAVVGGVTGALINEATRDNSPDIIIIEENTPGYRLFDSYGLSQVRCVNSDETLVYIYGPQESLICAYSNNLVSPGYYDVDPSGLTLIAR